MMSSKQPYKSETIRNYVYYDKYPKLVIASRINMYYNKYKKKGGK